MRDILVLGFKAYFEEHAVGKKAPLRKQVARMSQCFRNAVFSVWAEEGKPYYRRLERAEFCDQITICPICQFKRSRRRMGQFRGALDLLLDAPAKVAYAFVTLTIPTVAPEDEKAAVQSLRVAHARLRKDPRYPALGEIRVIEVPHHGYDPEDGPLWGWWSGVIEKHRAARALIPPMPREVSDPVLAQPHIHSLLVCPAKASKGKSYVSARKLRAMWRDALRLPQEDRRPVQVSIKWLGHPDEASRKLAYMLKPKLTPDDARAFFIDELLRSRARMRYARTYEAFGIFKAALARSKAAYKRAGQAWQPSGKFLGREQRYWSGERLTLVAKRQEHIRQPTRGR